MMSTIVSGNGTVIEKPEHSRAVRLAAQLISWVFHPLFIPVYVTIFLLYIHPSAFVALNEKTKVFKLLFVFVNTALFPTQVVTAAG